MVSDKPVATIRMATLQIDISNEISDALLFCGKRSDRCKGLLWMGTGFLLLYKRFEAGRLSWSRNIQEAADLTEEPHKYLMMGLNPLDPKIKDQMEALRIFNYPYQAIEEAVVNAFYHRDYMSFEPVTIELEPDCINIMNFPGIDRSISEKTIAEGKRFVSRYYRNRRLGEFLKELDLSEGHSSGIQQYRKN